MDDTAFHKALGEVRNGTDSFHFIPLYRWMKYSDGVKEVAESGCYWILDRLGLTIRPALRGLKQTYVMATVTVSVKASKAKITATTGDEDPPFWTENVSYTDMPDGDWSMLLTYGATTQGGVGEGHLILVTEY
jgi:hypothetical protein